MNDQSLPVTKHCSKCRKILPATLEFFSKLPTMKLGLASWCRSCANVYIKQKRLALNGPRKTINERFLAKVKTGAPGECWEWQAGRQVAGYGQFALGHRDSIGAHRFAWELTNGPVPDGLWVLHKCDNPPCCNPEHLFVGTPRDNHQDMIAKNRKPRGQAHHNAKLSSAQVEEVRARRKSGERYKSIAATYGVSWESIRRIAKGQSRNFG